MGNQDPAEGRKPLRDKGSPILGQPAFPTDPTASGAPWRACSERFDDAVAQ